jgi:hypothetical protein
LPYGARQYKQAVKNTYEFPKESIFIYLQVDSGVQER